MTSTRGDLEAVLVSEPELWREGPPYELFGRLRSECPVHWTGAIPDFPDQPGYWSVTRPEDIQAVSRDWRTYSSELAGITAVGVFPLELIRSMFIGMDPPRHDRLKMPFQAGFTPRRIAAHETAIREIVTGVLDRLTGREECDLVTDVAQPVVARVIGSFMGVPPEDDAEWARLMNVALAVGDPDVNPGGVEESLRMFPAFAHFARTATRDTTLAGQTIARGEKVVMWYVSSGRDEHRYDDPDRFDVNRNPEHQAFGAGGRHFCLGTAPARLELRVLFEESLARYPRMEPAGEATWVVSTFVNQPKSLPVRLGPVATAS